MAWSSPRTWVTSEVVTAAHMNQEVRDNLNAVLPDGDTVDTWSPGLSGTGGGPAVDVTGRQYQVGGLMHVWARFNVTGAGGGAGFWFVILPVASTGLSFSTAEGSGTAVGSWTLRDNSLPSSSSGTVLLRAADEVWFNVGPGMVSATFPFTIATDDVLSFHATYPVA